MRTVEQIYEREVKLLSPAERLHLVRLIADGLAASASRWTVDESDEWSDEDLSDLTRASLHYTVRSVPDEDDDA